RAAVVSWARPRLPSANARVADPSPAPPARGRCPGRRDPGPLSILPAHGRSSRAASGRRAQPARRGLDRGPAGRPPAPAGPAAGVGGGRLGAFGRRPDLVVCRRPDARRRGARARARAGSVAARAALPPARARPTGAPPGRWLARARAPGALPRRGPGGEPALRRARPAVRAHAAPPVGGAAGGRGGPAAGGRAGAPDRAPAPPHPGPPSPLTGDASSLTGNFTTENTENTEDQKGEFSSLCALRVLCG